MGDGNGEDDARVEGAAAEGSHGDGWAKARRILTPIVVILACISVVATTIGVWTNRTIWNEGKYMERIVPLAQEPAVIKVLADRITDQAYTALDVPGRVQDVLDKVAEETGLPPELAFLAGGPISQNIKDLILDQTVEFLSSDTFQKYWEQANATLHPKLVALLKGEYDKVPNVVVGDEVVQVDLVPVIAQVLRGLAEQGAGALSLNITIPELPSGDPRAAVEMLSSALGRPLPEDFGKVTIVTKDWLTTHQTYAKTLLTMGWVLLILTLVLIALALVLSLNRRRTVVWLGLGAAAAIVIGTVVLRNVVKSVVDSIQSEEARAAAEAIARGLGSSLRGAGALVAWSGVVAAVVAYLWGRPPWLEHLLTREPGGGGEVGGWQAWVGSHADGCRAIVIALAVIAFYVAGVTWLSILVVGGAAWMLLGVIGIAHRRAESAELA